MSTVRRFVFWIGYDGSRFPEMARGGTGYGVVDLLQQVLSDYFIGQRLNRDSVLRLSPSSRTDAGVHAIRSSVVVQIPKDKEPTSDPVEITRILNRNLEVANPGGLHIHNFHKVSPGFCIRRNVSYRRYTYRIAVAKDWEIWDSLRKDPSYICFSERNYTWLLPPGISPERINQAAKLFEGEQVMGSFFKHTEREKRNDPFCPSAVKNLLHVGISKGEAFAIDNELYDYYNISVIAKSFVREQIRRMVSCLILHGYDDRLPLSTITWLLDNPKSSNFFDMRIPIAPPNGLFLTDVVYDPHMFTSPVPYHKHSWDYDFDELSQKCH